MSVTQQKFDQFKIDKLRHYLEDMSGKNQPRLYEIFVDGLKVVPKTDDISQFDTYEQYMDEDTEKIRILVYNSSASPRNDQFCFMVSPRKGDAANGGLGEIDILIQDRLAAKDREHEMESVRRELQEVREQLEEAEAEGNTLRQELADVRSGKERKQLKGVEFLSVVLEGFVRRNPQLLHKIPGGEALAGLIQQDNEEKTALPIAPVAGASFSKKESTPTSLQPDQLRYIDTLRQLETTFQQPQLELVMQIIARFAESPETVQTVFDLLHPKNPIP